MLHEYHVIYSVRYYPRFHVTAIGTYNPQVRGHYYTYFAYDDEKSPLVLISETLTPAL
jgi:hypothetical protein